MRLRLVSSFFADSIQHIHSLRASGVMSNQVDNASGSRRSASFRSAGRSCTTPPGISRSSDKLAIALEATCYRRMSAIGRLLADSRLCTVSPPRANAAVQFQAEARDDLLGIHRSRARQLHLRIWLQLPVHGASR